MTSLEATYSELNRLDSPPCTWRGRQSREAQSIRKPRQFGRMHSVSQAQAPRAALLRKALDKREPWEQ